MLKKHKYGEEIVVIAWVADDVSKGENSDPARAVLRSDNDPCIPNITINVIAGDNTVNKKEKADGVTITGTAITGISKNPNLADIKVTVKWGDLEKPAHIKENGQWEANFTEDEIPEDGLTEVEVTATHGNCKSEPKKIQVPVDTEAPEVKINDVKDTDKVVTGTTEKDAKNVRVIFPNGDTETVPVDDEGNWSVDVGNRKLKEGETIKAIAVDEVGNESGEDKTKVYGAVEVYGEFSPNEDGINDWLKIKNIKSANNINRYPNNTIKIFNRWGSLVWEASGYDNDKVKFEGVSNGRATIGKGEQLPVGTYYYMLDLGDGSPIIKGWIYINR